jgi:hypothetical protein
MLLKMPSDFDATREERWRQYMAITNTNDAIKYLDSDVLKGFKGTTIDILLESRIVKALLLIYYERDTTAGTIFTNALPDLKCALGVLKDNQAAIGTSSIHIPVHRLLLAKYIELTQHLVNYLEQASLFITITTPYTTTVYAGMLALHHINILTSIYYDTKSSMWGRVGNSLIMPEWVVETMSVILKCGEIEKLQPCSPEIMAAFVEEIQKYEADFTQTSRRVLSGYSGKHPSRRGAYQQSPK